MLATQFQFALHVERRCYQIKSAWYQFKVLCGKLATTSKFWRAHTRQALEPLCQFQLAGTGKNDTSWNGEFIITNMPIGTMVPLFEFDDINEPYPFMMVQTRGTLISPVVSYRTYPVSERDIDTPRESMGMVRDKFRALEIVAEYLSAQASSITGRANLLHLCCEGRTLLESAWYQLLHIQKQYMGVTPLPDIIVLLKKLRPLLAQVDSFYSDCLLRFPVAVVVGDRSREHYQLETIHYELLSNLMKPELTVLRDTNDIIS